MKDNNNSNGTAINNNMRSRRIRRSSSSCLAENERTRKCSSCNTNYWGRSRIVCYMAVALLASYYKSEAFAVSINTPEKLSRGGSTAQKSKTKQNVLKEDHNGFVITNGDYGLDKSSINEKDNVGEDERENAETLVSAEFVAETNLPTDIGMFRVRAYRHSVTDTFSPHCGNEPCVIYSPRHPIMGPGAEKSAVNIRVHDQCVTSEVFGSQRCDCRDQLRMALKYVEEHGGAVIYLQQEGRGIGLANKIAAYELQDGGMDTVDANLHLGFPEDWRQYGMIPSILENLGIDSIALMTNNPRKVDRLTSLGIDVEKTVPMVVPQATPFNRKYLEAKQERMNHMNLREMLLTKTPAISEEERDTKKKPENINGMPKMNGVMAPVRKKTTTTPEPHIEEIVFEEDDVSADEEQAGVSARSDGYCFGRESVEEAIAAMARGEMVCVVDDMDRENEGDFIMAADACTPEAMAQIIRYSSGVICVAMEDDRMEELNLPNMVNDNQDPKNTAFAVTVDGSEEAGITTGISATDRSLTVRLLASSSTKSSDLVRPGHIFPLRAKAGGVLERDGHTEATVDLSRLAGRGPCGVLCEIVSEENPTEMARLPELVRFCKKHNLVLTSIVDLQQYRRDTEQ